MVILDESRAISVKNYCIPSMKAVYKPSCDTWFATSEYPADKP
jgi:hypothetical protein